MSDFVSIPPSKKRPPLKGFFQGGMMPATGQDVTALLILDLRSLKLTAAQGKKLEKEVREFVFDRLKKMKVDLSKRSAIDLSTSVFGISID